MKEEIKTHIKAAWGDWENVHGIYDAAMKERLLELDPLFVAELDKAVEGASFWYA